jgi:endonuclease/exonuclease/phosphatase family metal-dependent hydrolase
VPAVLAVDMAYQGGAYGMALLTRWPIVSDHRPLVADIVLRPR